MAEMGEAPVPAPQDEAQGLLAALDALNCPAAHGDPWVATGCYDCWLSTVREALRVVEARAREAGMEEAAKAIPTNWTDSLLTGPDALLGKPPYGCPDIERLLRGLAAAIRERVKR